MVRDVAMTLGITNGPLYIQAKIENGQPYVIEVTPRLDGCHMWRFIKTYCGVDLLKMSFDLLLGNSLEVATPEYREGEWRLKFLCAAPDTTYARSNYDVSQAEILYWYYADGDVVGTVNGYMEKGGYMIHQVG